MHILISRVSRGYFVDAVDPTAGIRVVTEAPVAAEEAFRLACEAGAGEDQALEALDEADRQWRRLVRAWRRLEVLGASPRIALARPETRSRRRAGR